MYGEYLDLFIRVVTALGTLIAAVGALTAAVVSVRNNRELHTVHVSINGRMDDLLRTTKKEGAAEERAEQKASGNGDAFIIKKLRE